MTLLHLHLALAVAGGAFTQAKIDSIGQLALNMTVTLVNKRVLTYATSSEIAAAATCGVICSEPQRPAR